MVRIAGDHDPRETTHSAYAMRGTRYVNRKWYYVSGIASELRGNRGIHGILMRMKGITKLPESGVASHGGCVKTPLVIELVA